MLPIRAKESCASVAQLSVIVAILTNALPPFFFLKIIDWPYPPVDAKMLGAVFEWDELELSVRLLFSCAPPAEPSLPEPALPLIPNSNT